MAEWHVPFDYIETHWTMRQFDMFVHRLRERIEDRAVRFGGKPRLEQRGGLNPLRWLQKHHASKRKKGNKKHGGKRRSKSR